MLSGKYCGRVIKTFVLVRKVKGSISLVTREICSQVASDLRCKPAINY